MPRTKPRLPPTSRLQAIWHVGLAIALCAGCPPPNASAIPPSQPANPDSQAVSWGDDVAAASAADQTASIQQANLQTVVPRYATPPPRFPAGSQANPFATSPADPPAFGGPIAVTELSPSDAAAASHDPHANWLDAPTVPALAAPNQGTQPTSSSGVSVYEAPTGVELTPLPTISLPSIRMPRIWIATDAPQSAARPTATRSDKTPSDTNQPDTNQPDTNQPHATQPILRLPGAGEPSPQNIANPFVSNPGDPLAHATAHSPPTSSVTSSATPPISAAPPTSVSPNAGAATPVAPSHSPWYTPPQQVTPFRFFPESAPPPTTASADPPAQVAALPMTTAPAAGAPMMMAQAPADSDAPAALPGGLAPAASPTEFFTSPAELNSVQYGAHPPVAFAGSCFDDGTHGSNSCANAPFDSRAFISNPNYQCLPYNAEAQLEIYNGKFCVPAQTPWVEMWRGLYRPGPPPPAGTILTGETNPIIPHFLVFGDYRTGIGFNDNGANEIGFWAHRLNLDFDLKITSTERIHAFWGPLDEDGRFTRAEFLDDNITLEEELDDDFDTLFFEGDAGYIWGGMTDTWAPFDLPFVAGKYPLLFQNGTWMVDAIEGFAFTFPGKHSRLLDWSNFEVTFFFGFDDVDSPAFRGNDNAADVYGITTFIDAYDGYFEIGYAFLDDKTGQGLSYNNFGFAYTRRYFQRISNSIRVIINSGQDPAVGQQTADGQLLLIENSLITCNPSNFVPYFNLFAGFDRPQSVARAAGTGGILLNTGINFESDGLTGFPTLDATANDTWGGAIGVNVLGPDFSWQLVTELAMVQTFGNGGQRQAVGDQYGLGARLQVPLTNAWIFRVDGIYGLLDEAPDISGTRAELRWKF